MFDCQWLAFILVLNYLYVLGGRLLEMSDRRFSFEFFETHIHTMRSSPQRLDTKDEIFASISIEASKRGSPSIV